MNASASVPTWRDRARSSLGDHRWVTIAVVYTIGVVGVDVLNGRREALIGLLAVTPFAVAFEWNWPRTAVWSLIPLLLAGTNLFGYNHSSRASWALRFFGIGMGSLLGVYAAMDRQRGQARLEAARERAEAEHGRRQSIELGQRTQAAAAALSRAITVEDVISATFDHAIRWLGGRSVTLWLLDIEARVIRFSGGAGYRPGGPESVAEVPLAEELPATLAVKGEKAVVYRSRQERDERWPALAGVATSMEATVVLRLEARGCPLGCLTIGFTEKRDFTDADLALLTAVSEPCALALDRALLYDAERRARRTLEFLADATELMISALEPDEVLRRLVRLAVPRLADWCGVYVAEDDHFRRVAFAVTGHPDGPPPLSETQILAITPDMPMAIAYRTGRPQLITDPQAMAVRYGISESQRHLLDAVGLRSALVVPIEAAGRPIGAMTVGATASRPLVSDHFAVTGLAARAGQALDNVRRYRQQRDVAETLIAALLPTRLPCLPTVAFAARYIPASGGVAGDWYDVQRLADDSLFFGVGDAAGHGLPAASTMAELRNGARSLAIAGMTPGQVLGHLSSLVAASDQYKIATALYAHLDPASGRAHWASAGHPPPLLVPPNGVPRFLDDPASPLGVPVPGGYVDHPLQLVPGSTLVIVSDGVIERRDENLDVGLEKLRAAVEASVGCSPDEIAQRIVDDFCVQPTDDTCLLIVRYVGTA